MCFFVVIVVVCYCFFYTTLFLCVAEREREREREREGGDIGCLFVFVYEEALVYFLLENMIKNYYYLPFFEIHTHTEKFRLQRKIKLLENARLVNFCVLHYVPKIEHEQNREDYSEAMSEMH